MNIARVVRCCAQVGVQATVASVNVAGALGDASLHLATATAAGVVSGGVSAATLPLRLAADLVLGLGSVPSAGSVARELVGGAPSRRCWQGESRAWVEVRELGGPTSRTRG